MKLSITRMRHAGAPMLLAVVAACSSAPGPSEPADTEPAPAENFYLGSRDVFAYLATVSGGSWQFTRITTSNVEPENGYLVRLNDLAPAFDTRVAECTPQAYTGTHKCNPAHPFRNKEVGVIKKLISGGIAAGTAGKVSDVSSSYRTSFDDARFNQAVDEALINSGLDRDRQDLLTVLDVYDSLAETSRVELQEQQQAVNAAYQDIAAVQLDIQPTITGLTEYYSYDLSLPDLIELVPASATSNGDIEVNAQPLLPCEARTCLSDARRAVERLRSQVDAARSQLASRANSGLAAYKVRCNKTEQQGYLFRLECPDEIRRNASEPVSLPLNIHIYARDFDSLYPPMELEDDNLRIEIDGTDVFFINKTPSYLTITTHTVYYNSNVETTAAKISVAPGAQVARPIQTLVSPAIEIESSYRQMTPDKSEGTIFEFGFAANYRVAGVATDSTLFTRRKFNAGCIIDNQLRPATCAAAPELGAEAAGVTGH